MPEYPRQLIIKKPLWAFMEHAEVYCTAACCGTSAFEVHPALILRRVIDENISKNNGHASFRLAWQQLKDIIVFMNTTELETIHGELPIWNDEQVELPEYWLPADEFTGWMNLWNETFEKASHYIGLDKD